MLPLKSVPAVIGWLWTWRLRSEAVEAADFAGLETASLGSAFLSTSQLVNEGSLDADEETRALLGAPVLTDITDIPPLQAEFEFPGPQSTSLVLEPGDLPSVDGVQFKETPPVPAPHIGKDRRRGLRPPLSTLILFLVCLGLFTTRAFKVRAGRKTTAVFSLQQQPQKPQQQQRGGEAGSRERQQLDEQEKLLPLATHLAETVGIDESLAVLCDFRSSVQRAKQVQRSRLGESAVSLESPEIPMKQALDKGVSALSRLYEVARQRGLSLAEKTRRINGFSVFSQEELQAVGGYLGSAFAGMLEFHLDSLRSSLDAFGREVEMMENDLKRLRRFEGTQDRRLLAALVADVEFIRAANEAVEKLNRFAMDLKSAVATALVSHFRREQTCMHRKCRDLLEEQRVLCRVERRRQLSMSDGGTAALEKLDALDEELCRAGQILEIYRDKIEQIERGDDILSANALRQQANAVGQGLNALLEAVDSRRTEISGVAGAQEAAEHEEVQRVLHSLTTRASQEAATLADVVKSMQHEVKMRQTVAPPFLWMRRNHGRKDTETNSLINPSVEAMLTDWLQQVADNAEVVASQAASAAAGTGEANSGSGASEALLDANRACMVAEALRQEAELLGLRAQLIASLEFDMQVSDILAQRAAAATGAATEEEEEQQHWRVLVSPQESLQVRGLLEQMKEAKEEALTERGLRALAVAAATMKVASFGLISIVHGHEKQ
ncbi:uncharacterized protein EMH_0012280 [Eimeria mitis]|uniref:Uncharacterized protein n=1 Tax=Eimeria mitis TaxID=44415 RepID=U6K3Y2_9EIME|nr:uncharacterized protein EMH_0012280 [Eimeria mitis]CDJ32379.1 hypothetical protein, conserved [Eimeria mitis]